MLSHLRLHNLDYVCAYYNYFRSLETSSLFSIKAIDRWSIDNNKMSWPIRHTSACLQFYSGTFPRPLSIMIYHIIWLISIFLICSPRDHPIDWNRASCCFLPRKKKQNPPIFRENISGKIQLYTNLGLRWIEKGNRFLASHQIQHG